MQSAFANTCEKIGFSKKLPESACCPVTGFHLCGTFWWYYCKVKTFSNHSSSVMKPQTYKVTETGSTSAKVLISAEFQTSSSINISTKSVCWELHGMGFHPN